MAIKIRKFTIHRFRGIPYLDLLLRGKSLIIKGDNGTGKSSVVEAFEYFFTGDIKEISSVKGMSIKKHASHVNYSYKDIKIEFEFNNDEVLTKTYNDYPSKPIGMKDYLISAKEQKFILRRKDLLKFIIETPGNKYKAISEILGTEDLDKNELELRRTRDTFREECRSLLQNSNEILDYLSKILSKDIAEDLDILSGLNELFENKKYPKVDSLDALEKYSEENFKTTLQKSESSVRHQKMSKTISLTQKPLIDNSVTDKIQKINEIRKKLLENRIEADLRVNKLLNIGVGLIEDKKLQSCPLCGHPIATDDLIATLKNRLKELELISEDFSNLQGKINEIEQHLKSINANLKTISEILYSLDDFDNFETQIQSTLALIDDFMIENLQIEDYSTKINIHDFNKLKLNISGLLNNIKNKCKSKIESYEISEEEKEAYEVSTLLQQVIIKYKDRKTIEKHRKLIEKQYEIANKIFNIYSLKKKEIINEIIQDLKDDIQDLYSSIHLDDPHNNIELMLDPNKRASLILTIDSFDKEKEDPRAYISEGHLDTLGICIFLAFVSKFNEEIPLIVLDDIVTTVDANHREKLANLLLTKFPDHQLIITTHDGIWYRQLCENQRTLGLRNKYLNKTIISWDISCGPQFSEYRALWEKIEENLNRGDFDVAGILSRRYLEWVLKQISSHMNVKVEFKENLRYNVGELFINSHLRMRNLCGRVINNDSFKNRILTAFKDLESWQYMGNILSHDNPEILSFPSSEIENFSFKVNFLYEQFLCPKCKSFLHYEQNYKDIRCIQPNCDDQMFIKLK